MQGSKLPGLEDRATSKELTEFFNDTVELGREVIWPCYWLPYTDLDEEGVYVDQNTGRKVVYTEWYPGEPYGKTLENCAEVVMKWTPPETMWNDNHCLSTCRRSVRDIPSPSSDSGVSVKTQN